MITNRTLKMATNDLKFHTTHSPVKIEINQGLSDILADWQRLVWSKTYVDGVVLTEIMEKRGLSKEALTLDALECFFSEVLLAKCKYAVGSEKKKKNIDWLMRSLHQGGLLYPVSSGLSIIFPSAGINIVRPDMQVNIQTTSTGLRLQEISTVKQLVVISPELCKDMVATNISVRELTAQETILITPQHLASTMFIVPDARKSYVIKAQATVEVSFESNEPKINILNQGISYGSDFIRGIADVRHWLEKLLDFLKQITKMNTVQNLENIENNSPSSWTGRP